MKAISPVLPKYLVEEITIAKDQPEYLPLPALRIGRPVEGVILTRWRMSWRERIRAFFTGDVYLQVMTFGRPLQPVALMVAPPTESDNLCSGAATS